MPAIFSVMLHLPCDLPRALSTLATCADTDVVTAASAYLREGGQGFWQTVNWPDRAYMLGRTGGYSVRGKKENEVALAGTANATPAHIAERHGGKAVEPWAAFELGAFDQSLRKLEANITSRSPLRWDPFHYEPVRSLPRPLQPCLRIPSPAQLAFARSPRSCMSQPDVRRVWPCPLNARAGGLRDHEYHTAGQALPGSSEMGLCGQLNMSSPLGLFV